MSTALPAALLVALALILPVMATAQSTGMTPSFAASEVYDGNLFASASNPRPSLLHRFGPRLELDRLGAPLSLIGRYTLDAEYVDELPQEGVHVARQLGSVQVRYVPMKQLTLGGEASYLDTRTLAGLTARPASSLDTTPTPPALNTAMTLDRGRVRARRFSIDPSADYQIDRRTRAGVGYAFTRDDLLGVTTDAHVAKADVAYRFAHLDTGSFTVIARKYVLENDTLAPSQVALLGWTHRFARRTVAALHAGPRFRDLRTDGVEGDASIRHGFGRTELELDYSRAETITLGLPGARQTDAAAATASEHLERALLRASAGIARTYGGGVRADLQYARVSGTTQVHPWLSVDLSLTFTWQRLTLTSTPGSAAAASTSGSGRVFHDLLALTLVVAPPKPLEL